MAIEDRQSSTSGLGSTAVYVDLDGTLVHTDLLVESALRFVVSRPLQAWRLIFWLARGKAHLKAQLALRVAIDPAALPYNTALLDHLTGLAAEGTPLYLATASNEVYANAVAKHVGEPPRLLRRLLRLRMEPT